jgi:hypothetical protein
MSVKRTVIAGVLMLRSCPNQLYERDLHIIDGHEKGVRMPLALMVRKLAPVLTEDSLGELSQNEAFMALLLTPGSLVDVASEYVPDITQEELQYLGAVPAALQEAVRASIAAAIDGGKAVQVQFSPGYDFGLHMWDYGDAVSVHLAGPYTDATQPERFPQT